MADSANILSILSALGGNMEPSQAATVPPVAVAPPVAPPVDVPQDNVLQGIAQPPTQAPSAPTAEQIYQAATAASPPTPKPRRSLLDTIGRISDVIAKVGGADPLYQSGLDAATARQNAITDEAQKIDLNKLKIGTDQLTLRTGMTDEQSAQRKNLGTALGALDGHPDAAALWPSIAEQAGIDPGKAQVIGKMLEANPGSAGILAKALGADKDNLGKNVFFGTDTQGKTVAYQVGPDGKPHILDFGAAGVTPSTPIKVIDTGGSNVIVGQNGLPIKILPNSPKPDTVLTTTTSRENNRDTNQTQLTIAGMPARAKDGADGKGSDPNSGLRIISDIQQGFDNLHRLKALPGDPGTVVGDITGAIGRTALGQKLGATTGLSAAAQERELLGKNLANLQSDLIKSLPGNATRTKFEQEIQKKRLPDPTTMSYATAQRAIAQIRDAYMAALKSQPKGSASPAPASNLPRLSPADAAKLAPGTPFIGLDGVQRVRH